MNKIKSFRTHVKQIGFFQTIFYLLQRLILKKGKLLKLKIPGLKFPVYLRNKYYDTHIFHQIFIRNEVDFNLSEPPLNIIDCGANIGLSSLYFIMKYPGCKIIAVEPEASNFEMLKKNTANYKDIKAVCAAVWYTNAALKIIDEGDGHAAFKTSEEKTINNTIGQVNGITMKDIFTMIPADKIDLVKMDIEGSEYELFDNTPMEWVFNVKNLAIEIHEYMRPGSSAIINTVMENKFLKSSHGEYSLFTLRSVQAK